MVISDKDLKDFLDEKAEFYNRKKFIQSDPIQIPHQFSLKEDIEIAVIDKEQIKKEIQAKENLFAETYNSGERKKIGYYADDAVSFAQNRAPLVGKEAIVEFLLDGIESNDNSNKISFTTNEVLDKPRISSIHTYHMNKFMRNYVNNILRTIRIYTRKSCFGSFKCISNIYMYKVVISVCLYVRS